MLRILARRQVDITESARAARSPSARGWARWCGSRLHRTAGLSWLLGVQALWFGLGFLATGSSVPTGHFEVTAIDWWRFLAVNVVYLVVPPAMLLLITVVVSRRALRILRLRRTVCIECGYDLRAAPHRPVDDDPTADGVCPECGRAFEVASLRRYWYPEAVWAATLRLVDRWLRARWAGLWRRSRAKAVRRT